MIVGVLGSTGFVGRNLIQELKSLGIKSVEGSLRLGINARDLPSTICWLKTNKITHLVNLAAECGGIGLNQRQPADLWRSTTAISHTVLEAALDTKIQKLIQVGTVCSYSQDSPPPFKETDLMKYGFPEASNLAYGVAKLNSLIGAQAFAKQYGLNVCNLLPVNMYGPYDHFNFESSHVIPAIILKISEAQRKDQKEVVLWGTGTATREFLHVGDFAKAVVLALQYLNQPDLINIGTGSEISIAKLANLIAEIMGFEGSIRWDTSKPDGQPRRCLDVSKAEELMGFKAKVDLQTGLRQTIDWFKAQQTDIGT